MSQSPTPVQPVPQTSAAFFVVMRRMRTPLVVLLLLFAVSVVGLALIPGSGPDGAWQMGLFEAFYFMSYTATTIGFGEIPQAFNTAQRLWVTFSIYLTVIGWAYAIGSLLAAVNDKSLRYARALQRVRRQTARLGEPFWIVAGYGQTGERLGRGLDELGHRFVAIDVDDTRIEMLDLGSLRADVPGVVGDARNPDVLAIAGLSSPQCAGVLALTDDEEANLAVTMSAAVLRPDVAVIARASDPTIQRRMREFGSPTIIDPFDRFGDHLGVALRAPTADRMVRWLTSPPGHPLPEATPPLGRGHWVLCGYGRFGRQVARDLRRDGLDVVAVDVRPHEDEPGLIVGNGTEPEVLARAGLASAGGFVAGTDNDTTNLSLIVAARRVNPQVSVVARQNVPTNHALFEAMRPDLLMVPSEVIAQDAIAHVGTPLLWQFLEQVVQHDEAWARSLLDRLVERVGHRSPDLFRISLTPHEAPALARAAGAYPALGDLMRDPQDRERPLAAITLLVARGSDVLVTPDDDLRLEPDDLLLVAGTPPAWRGLETTIQVDSAAGYVLTGRHVPAGWLWRTLSQVSSSQVSSGNGRR